jgi:hypothetical protein
LPFNESRSSLVAGVILFIVFHRKKTPPKHHQKAKKATSEILSYLEMALLFLQYNYLILIDVAILLAG